MYWRYTGDARYETLFSQSLFICPWFTTPVRKILRGASTSLLVMSKAVGRRTLWEAEQETSHDSTQPDDPWLRVPKARFDSSCLRVGRTVPRFISGIIARRTVTSKDYELVASHVRMGNRLLIPSGTSHGGVLQLAQGVIATSSDFYEVWSVVMLHRCGNAITSMYRLNPPAIR